MRSVEPDEAGPGDESREATVPGELAGSRLASIVFGTLDRDSSSVLCSSCCVVLAYDAALPPNWWIFAAWRSIAAFERSYVAMTEMPTRP